ncbi:hypothetical protein EHQ76_06945 [Leptospira barantonii]|uniref:Uncharacterized protein n=1 Tax=Leptospira barantonii TaxID=2023184 RepID=A0A5F2BK94_9LEPT|nr:hypothetical protein [Leptospira barantonii]TGM05998.1 hypothetical protein EHQ76_06945 [Leptospira barantonii]
MHEENHKPVTCEKCHEFLGQIARVFPSEEHLHDKKYMQSLGLTFLGEDQFAGDPVTSTAVWPGKSNGNRTFREYWYCCPVHPNCGHEYVVIDIEEFDDEPDDEISEIFREGRIRDAERRVITDERYKQNVEANEERIRLERKYGPISKSLLFSSGVWEEPTCSQESGDPDEWLANYINWKSKTLKIF